jgi:hypothetical protein
MKKSVIIFVLAALVIFAVVIWAMEASFSGNFQEIIMLAGITLLVGFAVFIGISRIRGSIRNEPLDDEFSKKLLQKASSLSYYISIYLWLVLMYFSDRIKLEAHSIMGIGILGMAITFFLSWLGLKIFGLKNE